MATKLFFFVSTSMMIATTSLKPDAPTEETDAMLQEMLTQVRDANHGLLQQADRHRVLAARLDDVENHMGEVAKENELMKEKLELQQIKQSKKMLRITNKLKLALKALELCSCASEASLGSKKPRVKNDHGSRRRKNKMKKNKKKKKKNLMNNTKRQNRVNNSKSSKPRVDESYRRILESNYRDGDPGQQPQSVDADSVVEEGSVGPVLSSSSSLGSRSRVLVTAGSSSNLSQIVDLRAVRDRRCPTRLPSFPSLSTEGSVATFVESLGHVMVCGGRTSVDKYLSTCHTLSETSREWSVLNASMREPRYLATATWMDVDHWWITGGFDGELVLQTTEVLHLQDGRFKRGPDLPKAVFRHCLLKVNATHVFIGGGYRHNQETWLMDYYGGTSRSMRPVPWGREAPHCAQYMREDGSTEVIMAGALAFGQKAYTHIFNVEKNSWRKADAILPTALVNSIALQMGNGGLILIGGQLRDNRDSARIVNSDAVLRYDPMEDEWVREQQRLVAPTSNFVALLLPNTFGCLKEPRPRAST